MTKEQIKNQINRIDLKLDSLDYQEANAILWSDKKRLEEINHEELKLITERNKLEKELKKISIIHLPEEELKKLAKMSMPRLLYELRKRNIDHAIVANPDNPKKQIIRKAKDHSKENLLWFWRNYKKAILIIIYTMEDCQILRFSKTLRGPRNYE